MKHAGYGRYDVEVNGQVVGRAVKRPEGWEATGAMKGMSVTVHGHNSLESACRAIGRALMGAEVRYELGQQPRSGADSDQLKARAEGLENQVDYYRDAERDLGAAYLRLRNILGAFDTPRGPTAEQVWAHTEDRAKGLVSQLQKLREEASIWKGMHAVAIEQREQLKTGYSEIQHESEALKSSVYQLRAFLKTLTPMVCVMLKNMISEKLAEEPAQSLAEHDAALLERLAGGDWPLSLPIEDYLTQQAARIRKEAAK